MKAKPDPLRDLNKTILSRMGWLGIRSLLALSEITGISYRRIRTCMEDYKKWTVGELAVIAQTLKFELAIGG